MTVEDNKMGVWGLPGTFPTGKVLEQVKRSDPYGLVSEWTRQKVNDAHLWYNAAMEKGIPPWTQQERSSATFISENTNISLSDANSFGFAIYTLAKSGEIDNFWYTGSMPKESTKIPWLPNPDDILKVGNTIKWVSILGLVGIGIYYTWPLLNAGRKTLKKRMA